MRALLICGLIAIAIVATVALMPISTWVFRNQLDLITKPGATGFDQNQWLIDSFVPAWLTDPRTYTGTSQSEELAHAIFLPYETRNAALERYVRDHPQDPLGLAVLVRMVCMTTGRTPDDPAAKDIAYSRIANNSFTLGREACLRGESLEPNNAYFPLMRATFDMSLNRLDEIPKALEDAASKSTYDNHVRDEALTLEKALLSAKGYRGELYRTGIHASLMLPDFSHVKYLARYLNRHGSLKEKRDLIQTHNTTSRGEETIVGFLVAFADVRLVLSSPKPISSTNSTNIVNTADSEWRRRATSFDAKLRAANIAPPFHGSLGTYEKLNRLVAATQKHLDEQSSIFQPENDASSVRLVFVQTAGPYAILGSLVFSVLFGLLAWAFTFVKSDALRLMAPHLLCLPVWFMLKLLLSPCADCTDISMTGLFFGIAQLAIASLRLNKRAAIILAGVTALGFSIAVEQTAFVLNGLAIGTAIFCVMVAVMPWIIDLNKRSRIATIVGPLLSAATAVALISIDSSDGLTFLTTIAYFIAVGVLWKNKASRIPKLALWSGTILFQLACIGAGAALLWGEIQSVRVVTSLTAIGLVGIYAASMFIGKTVQTAKLAACISFILFSVLYLGTVGFEVRENHRESVASTNLLNEAELIRKLAGVN